ncbi:[acyl-carrier-protein] S-malonyltransferase [Microbotryomycetes sp. JL221]|nr:[acyl-carrier-protein] S-malonyltransferase [Microbotryomycetes sp. JL221]
MPSSWTTLMHEPRLTTPRTKHQHPAVKYGGIMLRQASTAQKSLLQQCGCRQLATTTAATAAAAAATSTAKPTASTSTAGVTASPTLSHAAIEQQHHHHHHQMIWSDPAYLARYRDPQMHDRAMLRPTAAATTHTTSRAHLTSASVYTTSTSSKRPEPVASTSRTQAQTFEAPRPGRPVNSTTGSTSDSPRRRRLEMERLWSGGEASPPIPLENYKAKPSKDKPKHALLFPGSGSQYVGMGLFLQNYPAAKQVWREANEALESFEDWASKLKLEDRDGELGRVGEIFRRETKNRKSQPPLQEIVFKGPQERLTRSTNAQPAILITSIGFLRTLEQDFHIPVAATASAILGHSSGEYSAAVAAGSLEFADAVRLIRLHGLLTSYTLSLPSIGLSYKPDAPDAVRGQMSALVINPGHTHEEVTKIIKSIRESRASLDQSAGTVEVASFNSSAQLVLAGSREGIMRASEYLRDNGIASRAADLPVSAPFHCSFMKPAAEGMRAALQTVNVRDPIVPVVSCLDGSLIKTADNLITQLVAQIRLPVRWSQSLLNLEQQAQVSRLIFLGPGKALANLARKDDNVKSNVLSIATADDIKIYKDASMKEQRESGEMFRR